MADEGRIEALRPVYARTVFQCSQALTFNIVLTRPVDRAQIAIPAATGLRDQAYIDLWSNYSPGMPAKCGNRAL
jgi:hypothetical protein